MELVSNVHFSKQKADWYGGLVVCSGTSYCTSGRGRIGIGRTEWLLNSTSGEALFDRASIDRDINWTPTLRYPSFAETNVSLVDEQIGRASVFNSSTYSSLNDNIFLKTEVITDFSLHNCGSNNHYTPTTYVITNLIFMYKPFLVHVRFLIAVCASRILELNFCKLQN